MCKGRAVVIPELPAGRSRGKPEFFDADMYMFHVTGFQPGRGVLTEPVKPGDGAKLEVWRTDPAHHRHIPGPGGHGALFSTGAFSLKNSGNRTLRAPKRSWRIILDGAGPDNRLAGMTRINLKAMYNDPSQMREALAWRLFGIAGIAAPRAVHALFQQRIAGDDALLKLAGLRFAQMGVAAEVYADTPDQLDYVLRFVPAHARLPVVHLNRGVDVLHERGRATVSEFADRFAGRVAGLVIHDHHEMGAQTDRLLAAMRELKRWAARCQTCSTSFARLAGSASSCTFTCTTGIR